ncbi:unnamed protein product [Bemisia tabaci]|uniref:Uncharacterized protein n=1 Tax=Bemisia tabaci TaxID=7038 RepID=A0A9P0A5U7_BEMTA|nr:unnamed protein product [Bemisia tabaci]
MALRDQFDHGLINHKTRVELFRKDKLTFAEAVKIAEDWESAVINAKSADKYSDKEITGNSSTSAEAEVNYASSSRRKFQGNRNSNSYRDDNRSNQAYQQRGRGHRQRRNFHNDSSRDRTTLAISNVEITTPGMGTSSQATHCDQPLINSQTRKLFVIVVMNQII